MRLIILRLLAAACLPVVFGSYCAAAQNAAPPKPAAAQQIKTKNRQTGAQQQEQAEQSETGAQFACTGINNIGKISLAAYGVEINSVRARAVPGIADSFNLFEVSYKVSNNNSQKIWVSGEFVFGYDSKLAGAISANSGLTGVLPHETELIKGTVISKDIFFKTQTLCYRFNVDQQNL